MALPVAKPVVAAKAEPKVEPVSSRVVPDVQFETNSAKIKRISYPLLDKAVNTIREWGTSKVEVAGHTDKRDTSTEDYNLILSEKRAQSVKEYLVAQGIDPSRLIVKGYGYSMPIADNDPKAGSVVNRRVELIRQR